MFALGSPPALQVGPGFHVPVGVTVCTAACEVEADKEAESVNAVEEVVGTAGVVVVVVVVVGTLGATLPAVSDELDELDEPVAAGTVEEVTAAEV